MNLANLDADAGLFRKCYGSVPQKRQSSNEIPIQAVMKSNHSLVWIVPFRFGSWHTRISLNPLFCPSNKS